MAREVLFRGQPVLGERTLGGRKLLLLDRLGRGGPERYRVFDRRAGIDGDYRILTILPKSRTAAVKQRLRVLARLSRNPSNFLPVIETYFDQQSIYLLHPFLLGQSLEEYLEKARRGDAKRPTAVEAFKLVRGVAHTLQRFHHARNLGHGDIKPGNLLLVREPNRLVLIDYGSAWPIEETRHRDPGDGVTKHYAAPETLDDPRAGDFRSDQFSLSLVFYELLTLELPFDGVGGQAGQQQYRASFEGKLVPPSQLSPDRERLPPGVWPTIDGLITQGLAFNPCDRFGAPRDWLKQFDTIDAELRRGTHLGPINGVFVRWFDWLLRRSPRPTDQ